MIRKCSLCMKHMGEREPLENKSVTHGLCGECLEISMHSKTDGELYARLFVRHPELTRNIDIINQMKRKGVVCTA